MGNAAITVENLSKKYAISHQQEGGKYKALRDVMVDAVKSFGKSFLGNGKIENPSQEDFWALKDVSFEIQEGDRLGILGRNGAGKSTLLKLLSRITEPTSGRISIQGRVASLLEVGTGFHQELTGRENIFLNGAILGMGKEEIKRKFDEIVDFAEVEKFLDTPVKRYSSGMYVRLAFAVAAHLEPEILIVDEVLAVGDLAFQKKCLGKMEEVGKEGRTVIFVSHNISLIRALCTHGIQLGNGRVIQPIGETGKVINYYMKSLNGQSSSLNFIERTDRTGSGKLKFTELMFLDVDDDLISGPICGQTIKFRIHYIAMTKLNNVSISLTFNSLSGENKIVLRSDLVGVNYHGIYQQGFAECIVEKFPLSPGSYSIKCYAQDTLTEEEFDFLENACIVEVQPGQYFHTGNMPYPHLLSVCIEQKWQ